jgi:hypothetical protein
MQPRWRWNIKARIQAKDVCHVIVKKMSFYSGVRRAPQPPLREVKGILQNVDNLETTDAKPIGTV